MAPGSLERGQEEVISRFGFDQKCVKRLMCGRNLRTVWKPWGGHQDKALPLNPCCVSLRVSWAACEMPLPRACPKSIKSFMLATGILY